MYGVEPCRQCRMEQALRDLADEAVKFIPLKEAELLAHLASCPECQAHYARTNRTVPSTELRINPELPVADAAQPLRRARDAAEQSAPPIAQERGRMLRGKRGGVS